MDKKTKDVEVGSYSVEVVKKGHNEFSGEELDDGEVFYTVCLAPSEYYDTLHHGEAIVMAQNVRIEKRLKELVRLLKDR